MAALTAPLSKLSTNGSLAHYDDHSHRHRRTTLPQLTLGVVWVSAIVVWVIRLANKANLLPKLWPVTPGSSAVETVAAEDGASTKLLPLSDVTVNGTVLTNADPQQYGAACGGHGTLTCDGDSSSDKRTTTTNSTLTNTSCDSGTTTSKVATAATKHNFSAIIPPPSTEHFLQQIILLGVIMIYFYLCDYRKIFPLGDKVYERDTFLFVVFIFFLVGCFCTLRTTNDKILNRDHTEEWKGWMQVMFVWYHYFAAKEWYNWIRVYIACYVWMTGFGNFSFFWIRKDFSTWRAAKMLFRLDFLVVVICLTVHNAYVVYYICAMHTYWFLSVYALMAVFSTWNQDRVRMAIKLVVYAVVNAIIFDVSAVAGTVFRPLSFVLGLADNPIDDLHEWLFRVGLDHWACFVGMLCAYNYPHWETFITFLEGDFNSRLCFGVIGRGDLVKTAIIAVLTAFFGVWFVLVLPLPKYTYNRIHPYTSWIPIVVYVIARNLWPVLRVRYVHLFAWLGKVTLETYLCQLHIYLQSNAKHLITYIPGYPLMNFSLATVIYLTSSYQLFHLTTEISAFLIPTDRKLLLRNVGMFIGLLVVSTIFSLSLRQSGVA